MHRCILRLRVAFLALSCACAVFAQRDLATITGTVTDGTGGVVGGAKVSIIEQETGQVYELTTNSAGEFVRPALKPSTYTVTVTAPGFRKAEEKDVLVRTGERTPVEIKLTVGEATQTVEVQAISPLLQTECTQVGAMLNTKALTDIPLGGQRNFA